jgi:hypothetical protein
VARPRATVGPPGGYGRRGFCPIAHPPCAMGRRVDLRPASDPPSTHHDLRRITGVRGDTGWLPVHSARFRRTLLPFTTSGHGRSGRNRVRPLRVLGRREAYKWSVPSSGATPARATHTTLNRSDAHQPTDRSPAQTRRCRRRLRRGSRTDRPQWTAAFDSPPTGFAFHVRPTVQPGRSKPWPRRLSCARSCGVRGTRPTPTPWSRRLRMTITDAPGRIDRSAR